MGFFFQYNTDNSKAVASVRPQDMAQAERGETF